MPSLYDIACIGVSIHENKIFLLDVPGRTSLVLTEGVKERKKLKMCKTKKVK